MTAPKTPKNDSPIVNLTLASLEAEAVRPGPMTLDIGQGRPITFPDPSDMDWKRAEEWINNLGTMRDSELFQKWLSADDYDKLDKSGMSMGAKLGLAVELQKHYAAIFGAVGEGQPSGS